MTTKYNHKEVFNKMINFEIDKNLSHNLNKHEIMSKYIMEEFKLNNHYQVPKISKIIISCGPSRDNKIESVFEYIKLISGQCPVYTKARKSMAQYKIRAGMNVGIKVSLTGSNMLNFLNKLKYSLLNYRDFRALSAKSINQTKNGCQMNIGFEHIGFFPEMPYIGAGVKVGCTITIISKCGTHTTLDKDLFSRVLYYHGLPIKEIIEGGK